MHPIREEIERRGRPVASADIEHQRDRLGNTIEHSDVAGDRVIVACLGQDAQIVVGLHIQAPVIVPRTGGHVPTSDFRLFEYVRANVVVRIVRDEALLAELTERVAERRYTHDTGHVRRRCVMEPDVRRVRARQQP